MNLCLNMIVRNESARMVRCLNTVAPYITSWAIVDTGSTDDTRDVILKFFAERNIPGDLSEVPFENFEQARNAALDLARQSNNYWDFLLLMDADMELVVDDDDAFSRLNIRAVGYDMEQRAGTLRYLNRRMVNRSASGKYIGVTHEYLDVGAAGKVEGAYFIDHADGANRPDKFVRDIALLEGAIEKDPNNGRSWFYLAQSYRDAGRFEDAIKAYKQRIAIGGWDEEVWFSQYSLAHARMGLNDHSGFIAELVKAYSMRPSRAEPLYELANYYRNRDMTAASAMFAEMGMTIPMSTDALFVQDYAYTTGCKEEFAISGYYQDRTRDRAFKLCDEVALDHKGTPHSREQAKSNLFHYVKPLLEMAPSFKAKKLNWLSSDGYTPMNPSVAIMPNGDVGAIIRTVNYKITHDGRYEIQAGDGSITNDNPIDTRNWLVTLDPDHLTVDEMALIQTDFHEEPEFTLVRGYEDMRLFVVGDHLRFSATVRERNGEGWCEQWLGTIEDAKVTNSHVIRPFPPTQQHEKNWMPWARGYEYKFMYRLGETIEPTGKITKFPTGRDLGHISGGSQVVPIGDYWLALVHEARLQPNGQRYYQHRFASFWDDGSLRKLSLPFVFGNKEIEFAAGLCPHPNMDGFILSYGVRDAEAWFGTISMTDVVNLLNA